MCGEDLEGIGGGEPIFRIYCMKKELLTIKGKYRTKEN